MFELNLFSPKVQEILMKKPLLLTHLKKQGINQFDLIHSEMWFMKNTNITQPLWQVVEDCQESIRDGFLTPITSKSQTPAFTIDLLIDEILDNIQYQHLKTMELLSFKNIYSNKINILQDLRDLEHICPNQYIILNAQYDKIMDHLTINDIEYTDSLKLTIPTIGMPFTFRLNNDLKQFTIAELILNINPIILLQNQIQLEVPLLFPTKSIILQITLEISLNQELLDRLILESQKNIDLLDMQINEKEQFINQLLIPFSNIRYTPEIGIFSDKDRDNCCIMF